MPFLVKLHFYKFAILIFSTPTQCRTFVPLEIFQTAYRQPFLINTARKMKSSLLTTLLFLLLGQSAVYAQGPSCNPDVTPPVPLIRSQLFVSTAQGPVTVFAQDFDINSWDNCTTSTDLSFFLEPAPASTMPPGTNSIEFTASQKGFHDVAFWVVDAAGNANFAIAKVGVDTCVSNAAMVCNDQVTVALGIDGTALLTPDMVLEGNYCPNHLFLIQLDLVGPMLSSITLTASHIGQHLVRIINSNGNSCWGTLIVTPGLYINETCPQLYVSLATNRIRPCFENDYSLSYANASAFTVPDAYIELELDADLNLVSSTIPATNLGNNNFKFELGTLDPGETGLFFVKFHTDCDAPVGTTHCSEARIYPDTICPIGLFWSGAEVSVDGRCENDSIFLSIKNIGTAPNAQILDYVVVEDVLMLTSGNFVLADGQTMNLAPIAGTGATYRLEAQQEPGYPYSGMPSVTIEGCGGLNPGMVTVFPTENSNPTIAIFCRESINAYDPNDKQALPKGYGSQHFIEKNTSLEYMIRFQNTGTDTAYKVVLVDTLSAFLAPQSLRLGAASHPYKFTLSQGNILRITFDNIKLPHKAINDDGSQGFVQFSIQQQPNNPDNTRIENDAAIYFDFNPPIITNTTFHTIGSNFLGTVSTHDAKPGQPQLTVFPNPASDILYFRADTNEAETYTFLLTDALGRQVEQRNAVRLPMVLERGALASGTYFFQFIGQAERVIWRGKVMVK